VKPHTYTDDYLTRPHTIAWRAHIFAPDGSEMHCDVESGSITLSGRDRSRTHMDVTLVDDEWACWDPTGVTGASPFGGHVSVSALIGNDEIVVAAGIILETQRQRPDGGVRVGVVDYGVPVGWDLYGHPRTFNRGAHTVSTITTLMEMAHPASVVVGPGVSGYLHQGFVEERSQEAAIVTWCADINIVVWMDELRRLHLQGADVLASSPPVYTLSDGPAGTVTKEDHTLSRDGVPSVVVVTGEQPQGKAKPAWAVARQTTGNTAYTGPYGRVTEIINVPTVITNAVAQTTANTFLAHHRRLNRNLQLDAVANPALEPGDRVDAVLDGSHLKLTIDEVRFTIGPDPMSLTLLDAQV